MPFIKTPNYHKGIGPHESIIKSGDPDRGTEKRVRYPSLKSMSKPYNIGGLSGQNWLKATAQNRNGRKADGFGETGQIAKDDAYTKTGGSVDPSGVDNSGSK